ncbi:MAG: hypothetical protein NTY41_14025 [Proteobacteria bacterium]|nr:hypothetical protein [Pseudomonadota bacterium]
MEKENGLAMSFNQNQRLVSLINFECPAQAELKRTQNLKDIPAVKA